MRRILYLLLILLAAHLQSPARTPIRQWLTAMPDSVMPLLTKNNRLDFIDFYDAQMEAVVTNRLDGKSRMDMLTEDFLQIGYTRSTDITMKLLPVNDSTDILCMITTIKATANDSRIAFYDDQWMPLPATDYIIQPRIEDFCTTLRGDSATWAWSKLDIFFRTYQLNAENTELKCTLTTTDYLSPEDHTQVAPYISSEPLTYRWTDSKYQRHE